MTVVFLYVLWMVLLVLLCFSNATTCVSWYRKWENIKSCTWGFHLFIVEHCYFVDNLSGKISPDISTRKFLNDNSHSPNTDRHLKKCSSFEMPYAPRYCMLLWWIVCWGDDIAITFLTYFIHYLWNLMSFSCFECQFKLFMSLILSSELRTE